MHVNHQLLDFDLDRPRALFAHLDAHAPDLVPTIGRVTWGDLSCSYRNTKTLAQLLDTDAYLAFREHARARGLTVHFQLPLVVKELEFRAVLETAQVVWDEVDGFVTGDLGMVGALEKAMDEGRPEREIVLAANVLNKRYAEVLSTRFRRIRAARPLFHKRAFLHQDPGFPRDLVVYGNMMINSSTFCFHCGDLPTQCNFSCEAPKELIMENERLALVGRSLTTFKRLDLVDDLATLPTTDTLTLMDLDLTPDEVTAVLRRAQASMAGRVEA